MSKKVLCADCGFLCWHIQHESGEGSTDVGTVNRNSRAAFQQGKSEGRGEVWDYENQQTCSLGCLRALWHWTYSNKINSESVNAEELRKPRKCSYYFKFEPGYGPEEHKELKRESDTRRVTRNATLLGAGIGAAAAIVTQVVYALLTK